LGLLGFGVLSIVDINTQVPITACPYAGQFASGAIGKFGDQFRAADPFN
jgi:hypothetical protein